MDAQLSNAVQFLVAGRNRLVFALSCCLAVLSTCSVSQAQFGFFPRNGVVGGIKFDAEGTLREASKVELSGMLKELRGQVKGGGAEFATDGLRMVSLKGLQQAIAEAKASNSPISEEMQYLAGLQRVEYVFVYPESNDIVLAGPAEAWVVREDGSVVGKSTGKPVLQLEDLLVALRNVEATRKAAMTVSIDPTAEGERRLNQLLRQVSNSPRLNEAALETAMKKAFGPQTVSLNTVPKDSRMARTLVTADYRMKRLAMNLEPAPVAGLPSYMAMSRNTSNRGTQPRWWMASDYDAVLHTEDMLAWKLTGIGIKTLTEEEFVDANTGNRSQTGRANRLAQKWADQFTSKFDELCRVNSSFGDLRNVMDLNVVATIIAGHELEKAADCDLSLLKDAGQLPTPEWKVPEHISPECSFIRGSAGLTVSASGGVEMNPWKVVAEQSKVSDSFKSVYVKSNKPSKTWWWN